MRSNSPQPDRGTSGKIRITGPEGDVLLDAFATFIATVKARKAARLAAERAERESAAEDQEPICMDTDEYIDAVMYLAANQVESATTPAVKTPAKRRRASPKPLPVNETGSGPSENRSLR